MFNVPYNEQIIIIRTYYNWREKDIEIRFALLVLLQRSFRNLVGTYLNVKTSCQGSSRLLRFQYECCSLWSRRILRRNVSLNTFYSWFLFCVFWVIGVLSSLFSSLFSSILISWTLWADPFYNVCTLTLKMPEDSNRLTF